ncbi:replication initiation and membrane attachment family protein [Mesobacillus zeae]|uniref:Replication initiation and membrane attachment protein n=1 Tax=Mesobacillus zeae TaxID=1917180 RepID=A0A398B666_9BACI|nr:replication initiation and membrane attachment family protein [Mesobacillus zeae]RID83183.1 Replication initiation and membrane attachment protein [Mesobacillus zeae]
MAQHWQELLPVDQYTVSANGLIHEYDRKVLTFLYQPLIGPSCLSLYLTLWAELEENRLWSGAVSHHSLMTITGLGLNDIYQARLKLEAMGLLKTYVKNGDSRSFVYELQPPLSPEQFFLDGMLNIYLYRKIGKNQFGRLKRFFSDKAPAGHTAGYENITRAFQDVFVSVSTDALKHSRDAAEDLEAMEGKSFISRTEPGGIQVDPDGFDFGLLTAGIKESLVPGKALSSKVKEAISKLSFLYGIDALQMKNLILGALTEEDEIDVEELRKAARDWYQFENNDQLPALLDRVQPISHRLTSGQPSSTEEKLIHYLETTSPRQYLLHISDGAAPSKNDLHIIEEVMFKQKLQPGVVNVLIEYVMLKTDMKLNKGYMEKIAGHWARKQIKTVKEAMELAKKEHRQYLEWAEEKKGRSAPLKNSSRKEHLPDWFEKKNESQTAQVEEDFDFEEERKKLEEELKNFEAGR